MRAGETATERRFQIPPGQEHRDQYRYASSLRCDHARDGRWDSSHDHECFRLAPVLPASGKHKRQPVRRKGGVGKGDYESGRGKR